MAKGSGKQKEKLVQELDDQIEKLQEALSSFRESIMAIQEGDGDTPYWNGNNACTIIKNALTQYETDAALLSYIKECQATIKR